MIKRRGTLVVVCTFLIFWGMGMMTAFSSGACRKGLSKPERTDRACRISRSGIMGFRKIGQPQRPSDAELYIGYGVASWRAGELNQAREAFEQAFEWGRKSRNMVNSTLGMRCQKLSLTPSCASTKKRFRLERVSFGMTFSPTSTRFWCVHCIRPTAPDLRPTNEL